MSKKRTIVGKWVHSHWGNLQARAINGKYFKPLVNPKNECYLSIEIMMTREEFRDWGWSEPQKTLIESLKRPSLDRKDKSRHYSIDNIQIIELTTNIAKDKLKFKNGSGRCFRCHEIKNVDLFCKDSRRQTTGRTTICKQCDSKRKKE